MQISSMSGRTAFKAQVENRSPLINGNWEYLQTATAQSAPTAPKKSSFMKKALITLASIGVIAGLLAWGRGSKAVSAVMDKAQTFKAAETIKDKALWILGKGGDYVKLGWSKVAGYATKMFKHAPEVAEGAKSTVKKGTAKAK